MIRYKWLQSQVGTLLGALQKPGRVLGFFATEPGMIDLIGLGGKERCASCTMGNI
jgi:hypothetical protein